MQDKPRNRTAILLLTLSTRVVLAAAKLIIFFSTGFLFLLGEALNNVTDIVVVSATIISVKLGGKGGDMEHPFGHRRLESVTSLIIAVIFIAVTSFQLFRASISKLFAAPGLTGNVSLVFYLLIGSFLLNLVPLPFLLKKENRQDISLKTELFDTINDGLSIIASLIGLGLIYWGFPLGDPIATMVIALLIAFDAVLLIRENMNLLLGKAPDPEFYQKIQAIVTSHEQVKGVHDMIGEYIGPEIVHMDFDMELDPDMTLKESDRLVGEIKELLQDKSPKEIRVSIHPCAHQGEDRRVHTDI
ncbi:MAG: cation diffusion facilitator family transporter [Candidatus Bipolaricaulota bacterium]